MLKYFEDDCFLKKGKRKKRMGCLLPNTLLASLFFSVMTIIDKFYVSCFVLFLPRWRERILCELLVLIDVGDDQIA
jgi:hypothetical protein